MVVPRVDVQMMTQEEYGEVYQQGFARTVRALRCRGASRDDAEDVAQSAWMQGWRKLAQLRDENMIVGWINMIAVNLYRRSGRMEARYQQLPEFELCGEAGIDLVSLDVSKVLNSCRATDRPLFELQLCGMTSEEIAARHGVTATAIRLRLHRARHAVRETLKAGAVALQESYALDTAAAA